MHEQIPAMAQRWFVHVCGKHMKKIFFLYFKTFYGQGDINLISFCRSVSVMRCEGERLAALRNINLWLSALSDLTHSGRTKHTLPLSQSLFLTHSEKHTQKHTLTHVHLHKQTLSQDQNACMRENS